jgi:predicted O-linked N-acetylglucosamine transferase (SPINDLY family)
MTTFTDLLTIAEALGTGQGHPAVVRIYKDWIASRSPTEPGLPAAWFNLGTELGNGAAAIDAYRQALVHNPAFAPAALNLGLQLERAGDRQGALATWEAALQSSADRTALLNQRARLLEQSGDLAAATELLQTSLLTDPNQPDAVQHWLHNRQRMCDWPLLTTAIPGLSPGDLMAQSGPLASLALTDDVATQTAIGAAWIARKTEPKPRLSPGRYTHAKLRIGYLSSDFCSHAMSYLIAELFERHDRGQFEIHGYDAGPDDGSAIRARVLAAFDSVTPIQSLTDEQAARKIRADEIDILIDLNGLTSGGRLQILRWKPAPVQATYLGFVGPVPLPELDYMLCDGFVAPSTEPYRPAPLPIEGLYQANDSKRVVGAPIGRAEAGLPEDGFVLCCFSNHYKITEPMFAAWNEILRRAPNAVLWLTEDNRWSRQNLRRRCIDADRLIFAPRTDPATYMARLAVAGLFLDTFPFNAGTVASDALRMGLPLLTLAGRSFASRMAAAMLRAIGATTGIAGTMEEYIATAVRFSTDPAAYGTYRARFTPNAWQSTLGDTESFTRRFEAALLRAASA